MNKKIYFSISCGYVCIKQNTMRTENLLITIDDVEFQVQGIYYPYDPGSYEQPPEQSWFEVTEVKISGMDVYEILIDAIHEEIAEKALNLCE